LKSWNLAISSVQLESLADVLISAAADARQGILEQHSDLIGLDLAYQLKDRCFAAWSNEPGQAVAAAAALMILAAHTDDPEISALAAWAAGIAALAEGRMEDAITALDDAVARFTRLGQPHRAASTQVGKLMALARLGRYDEAISCGLSTRTTLLELGDEAAAGRIEMNLGNIAFRRDNYADAESYYRAAHRRLLPTGDPALLAGIESGLADVLTQRHQFAAARELYEQALRRAESASLAVVQAEAECNLGNLALAQGRYDQALTYLERSRRRYAALDMPHESAYADFELAEAYLELNMLPEAAAIFARVTPMFTALGMRAEQAWALAQHGQTAMLLGDHDAARQRFAAAQELFVAEGNDVRAALVTLFDAQLHYQEGDYRRAAEMAARAQAVFSAAGNQRRNLLAAWLQGEALRAAGDLDVAQALLQRTLEAAEASSTTKIAQRCVASLGLLASTRGQADAETLLLRAVALVESMRAPLPAEEFRTAFIADKLSPFNELVRLCLTRERLSEAFHYVERARSRALVEMLGGTPQLFVHARDAFEAELLTSIDRLRQELNWYYQRISRILESDSHDSALAEQLQTATQERETTILELTRQLQQHGGEGIAVGSDFDLHQLQAMLDAETALVEYYSLDDELFAFVVTADHVVLARQLASQHYIEELVERLRFQTDALRRGIGRKADHLPALLRRSQHYLARLYDALLRPLERLFGHRRLVIVPQRALHYVPFHALFDGTQYVVERQEICTAPSAAVLQHCLLQRPTPHKRPLFLGVPDRRAPRVRDEVEVIAPLWPHRTVLLDDAATLAALQEHAGEAGIVHLACHGQFRPDRPLFSSLRLADGWLTTRDAYGLNLNCDLVVLSACETGVGALIPGDELIGLARGFFAAGAPSLLVSLWTVDDTTTAELMHTFYQLLRAGARPAAALRQAQCTLLHDYPHPFFWAPFVLMGRW
jgi:CHAT domain-containing protein